MSCRKVFSCFLSTHPHLQFFRNSFQTNACYKMPLCQLLTNVSNSSIPQDFESKLTQLVSEVLSKPVERITVVLQPDQRMARAGTTTPTCLLHVWSIAVFSAEKNPEYAAKISPFLSETLGIDSDRVILTFHDIKREQVN